MSWQPTLIGSLVRMRPLTPLDFEPLFAAASDPLIWEQHPEPDRYKLENFTRYFRQGIESQGALAVIDQKTGQIMGSSRFTLYDSAHSSIEVGYTFLSRSHWGQGHNREIKFLMLNFAFQFVDQIYFYVGEMNFRSQAALARMGATEVGRTPSKVGSYVAMIYQIKKQDWIRKDTSIPFIQPNFETSRLSLESVVKDHAPEFFDLLSDSELNQYIPFDQATLEQHQKKCTRWENRRSPNGTELWLNWLAREKKSGIAMGHFQFTIPTTGVTSVGYVVKRSHQNQGMATEALAHLYDYLRDGLGIKEVKAWADTRNLVSHKLAKKLGMTQIELIKDADFFKGASSDEYVF